jgi:hypothetical protein
MEVLPAPSAAQLLTMLLHRGISALLILYSISKKNQPIQLFLYSINSTTLNQKKLAI